MPEQVLDLYNYITTEETAFQTVSVPITGSKEWNMKAHIERCTNVANAWFHTGTNDGNRPYKDIVSPIINVAFRSEGFDVKDIVPFVNDSDNYYKSFLIKKFHPKWARDNEIDTFIDDLVETSVIYDLALIKNVSNARPEVVKLQSIAFCDQTDIMSGPICLKHQYSIADLLEFKGKWDDTKIDEAIIMSKAEKTVPNANEKKAKTPGKYIEVYELHGMLPDWWMDSDTYQSEDGKYTNQLHIVSYYTGGDGKKNGISLFKGKGKSLDKTFKALKIDRIKSHGRACGRSIVESLFEPQVWTNYSEIKIKEMLDSSINLLQTDSEEWANQPIANLKQQTVLKHEQGRPITKVNNQLTDLTAFTNYQIGQENNARVIGSASDAQLGTNPTSGTPFALQSLIVQQGEGIHEYRKGKIATFVSDVLYRDWILGYLVDEMNGGKKFSEVLTLDEMQEISDTIANNVANKKMMDMMLDGKLITEEAKQQIITFEKENFKKGGSRKFMETLKGELSDIPMSVYVNIVGKQKSMAQNADKLTNLITAVLKSPQAFSQVPGISKIFNELLENSGFSPIDFTQITQTNNPLQVAPQQVAPVGA